MLQQGDRVVLARPRPEDLGLGLNQGGTGVVIEEVSNTNNRLLLVELDSEEATNPTYIFYENQLEKEK